MVTKNIKISKKYNRIGAGYMSSGEYIEVPGVRMQGEYLRKAGFEVGAMINVYVTSGKIVITLAE